MIDIVHAKLAREGARVFTEIALIAAAIAVFALVMGGAHV